LWAGHPPNGLSAVSGVTRAQGEYSPAVFYSLEHPTPYAYVKIEDEKPLVEFVKPEADDQYKAEKQADSAGFPRDFCREFNLGICKNIECAKEHKCSKCLKSTLNLMNCNCVGAKEFRNTISSGIKKEVKKPDLPLGGCVQYNIATCSQNCAVGHHCAICLGKNPAISCACQGAKEFRKALATMEQYETRKVKRNLERREKLGWPINVCRSFNTDGCSKQVGSACAIIVFTSSRLARLY
jgi:hypothetical protein